MTNKINRSCANPFVGQVKCLKRYHAAKHSLSAAQHQAKYHDGHQKEHQTKYGQQQTTTTSKLLLFLHFNT